ncbi:hypothetical protein [Nocardia aurea]|uniref:Uncharacterized protein n=1 Tax=Nocardia aurea TaxID=2144174 RepID=A0ABV3FQN4_9NOCA
MADNPQREDIEPEDQPVVWPDPSPLNRWWEEVMGLSGRPRRPKAHTAAA